MTARPYRPAVRAGDLLFVSAGGYHHHLGTNIWAQGPSPSPEHARLLEWELIVPSSHDLAAGHVGHDETT